MAGFLGCSPSQILELPSSDFAMLAAYARVEPFGVRRDDWHHSKTQSIISNAVGTFLYAQGYTKRRTTQTPADFAYPRKKTNDRKLAELNAGFRKMAAQKKCQKI